MTATVIPFPTKLREPVVQPPVEHPDWAKLRTFGKMHKVKYAERDHAGVFVRTACGRQGRMIPGLSYAGYCVGCQAKGWAPPDTQEPLPSAS